jgi:hypothetical protein
MMKNRLGSIALVLNCLLLYAGKAWSADPTSPVQGTWQLVSYQTTRSDGTTTDLYGPNPLGVLIYDASGHMSVHLLKRNLRQCGTIDRRKCPDAEARLAFDNYAGYWGRYEVN